MVNKAQGSTTTMPKAQYDSLVEKTIKPQTQGIISKEGHYILRFVWQATFTAGATSAFWVIVKKALSFKSARLLRIKSVMLYLPTGGIQTVAGHYMALQPNQIPVTEVVDSNSFATSAPANTPAFWPSAENNSFFSFPALASADSSKATEKLLFSQDGFAIQWWLPQAVAIGDVVNVQTDLEFEIVQ